MKLLTGFFNDDLQKMAIFEPFISETDKNGNTTFRDNRFFVCERTMPDEDGYTPINGKFVTGEKTIKNTAFRRML